jgi:hypothetical protein
VLRATGDEERAGAAAWAAVIDAAVRREADPGRQAAPPAGAGRALDRVPDPAALPRIADALAGGVPLPAPSAVPTGTTTAGTV